MKVLLLYKEEDESLAGEFRPLLAEAETPAETFPIASAEGTGESRKKKFFSIFNEPPPIDATPQGGPAEPAEPAVPIKNDSPVTPPTHVLILSALDPGWIDFLAGFSCGCRIPLLVHGKDAAECVPDVFNFCFKLFDATEELRKYLAAEYKAHRETISQKGSNTAREALLDLGIPVSGKSMANCVDEGFLKEVSLFLDAGFSPDTKNENGVPLLNLSARKGKLEILQLLLRSGANVNQPAEDRGCPAILDAALGNHKDMVKELIEAGADVNVQSKDGQSPLIVAIGAGYDEVAEILFRAGADPDRKDLLGASARTYATLFQKSAILALFNSEKK